VFTEQKNIKSGTNFQYEHVQNAMNTNNKEQSRIKKLILKITAIYRYLSGSSYVTSAGLFMYKLCRPRHLYCTLFVESMTVELHRRRSLCRLIWLYSSASSLASVVLRSVCLPLVTRVAGSNPDDGGSTHL
jgi:hypothetical protein